VNNNETTPIIWFDEHTLQNHSLPQRFTFPFYYETHPLASIAAAEVQQYLETQTELQHNFGLDEDVDGMPIGKMFGVLIISDNSCRIGYLSAFSGKLAGTNYHPRFVPPVFDMLTENSFFLREQDVIDAINRNLEAALADEQLLSLRRQMEEATKQADSEMAAFKQQMKENKENRRLRREANDPSDPAAHAQREAELAKESHYDRHMLRVLKEEWKQKLADISTRLTPLEERIEALKNERKERSARLQEQLFEQYAFLNKDGKRKSLQAIFSQTAFGRPPAGAGECATPKLLQYAFTHGYTPLAMAEFWWGAPPSSEVRQHKQFYPACAGKCKPILEHMLEGIPLDDNPFLQPTDEQIDLSIVYDDEYLTVVNKPSGLRSVPGVDIADSVYTRLKTTLNGTEPLIVHRLDMGTSGLLVVAKTPEVHKHLQRQFLLRTVSKRYTALLSRAMEGTEGAIDLPLIPDHFNRPRQLVCFETGKPSHTTWRVVAVTNNTTLIHFWPHTGRTHQLRVHAAHPQGLNAPIVGDDLYGTAAHRLHLHAGLLEFVHPKTRERLHFEVPEEF
jgi:tRNA pseudouridine32 synthase/23S rRNA pseudouridine746 synthase